MGDIVAEFMRIQTASHRQSLNSYEFSYEASPRREGPVQRSIARSTNGQHRQAVPLRQAVFYRHYDNSHSVDFSYRAPLRGETRMIRHRARHKSENRKNAKE